MGKHRFSQVSWYHQKTFAVLGVLSVLALSSGCLSGFFRVSYYDPLSYKNLTDAKPMVSMLYNTFTEKTVHHDKIEETRLMLAQIYEYEKGKGQPNSKSVELIEIIQGRFEKHVADRMANGPWSKTHLENKKENILEAFDIAIETESKKNKER